MALLWYLNLKYMNFLKTYPDSCDFHANVEHLTLSLGVGIISTQNFIPAREFGVGHVLQTVRGEGPVIEECAGRPRRTASCEKIN